MVEIVLNGSYGASYHVTHDINGLDINEIIKRDIKGSYSMVGNVMHLLETKGRYAAARKYNEKCKKIFDKLRKEREEEERLEKLRLKEERLKRNREEREKRKKENGISNS